MTGWTTIPPWLYRNDLPDDQLQAEYAYVAEQRWLECVRDREALEREVRDLRALKRKDVTAEMWSALADELGERYDWLEESSRVEARAKAFMDETRAALARYRGTLPDG